MGRELPALAALVLLVASYLPGKRTLFEVIEKAWLFGGIQHVDALFYVAPPYAALAIFVVLQLTATASRRRAHETIACFVVVVAAIVHTIGLFRLVDRTPREFPWELMTAIGAWSLVAIGGSIALAGRASGARRSGCVIAAYAALLVPLSVSYLVIADDRHAAFHSVHSLAHLILIALAVVALRRRAEAPAGDFGLIAALVARGALGVLVLGVTAALPWWPRSTAVYSFSVSHVGCELDCELARGPVWEVFLNASPECAGPHAAFAVAIGVAEVLALGLWLWLGYRGSARSGA